jgi:anti-anti-sigma factor
MSSIFRQGNGLLLRIQGPVNRETVAALQQLVESVSSEGAAGLTLDLRSADYIDSDGIRWLQQLREALHARNAALRLTVRDGSRIDRTLHLLQLEMCFPIERKPAEAESSNATTA